MTIKIPMHVYEKLQAIANRRHWTVSAVAYIAFLDGMETFGL